MIAACTTVTCLPLAVDAVDQITVSRPDVGVKPSA
jgi:hypothetical protein